MSIQDCVLGFELSNFFFISFVIRVLKAQILDLEKQFFLYYFIIILYYFIILLLFEKDEAVGYINIKCY